MEDIPRFVADVEEENRVSACTDIEKKRKREHTCYPTVVSNPEAAHACPGSAGAHYFHTLAAQTLYTVVL